MKPLIIFAIGAVFLFGSIAEAGFDWQAWDQILKERVKPTQKDYINYTGFDYDGLRKERAGFDELLARLAEFDPGRITSAKEQLAFWINTYNLAAVRLVIENPKIASIKNIGGFFSSVWKEKAILLGRRSYSLDYIEHQILRKMGEPRIHFAIVCASLSCPDLRAEAYRAELIDQQLDEQVKNFLANPSKGLRLDLRAREIVVSKIFSWFEEDFGSEDDLMEFLDRYRPKNLVLPRGWKTFDIGYLYYNWNLNSL
jgi:hypothetical protein